MQDIGREGRKSDKTFGNGETDEESKKPKIKKFDIEKIKCHKCGLFGHFKTACQKSPKQKAFMAKEGDDGPMMLMLKVSELMEKEDEPPTTPAKEIVTLVEEKVYLHDQRRLTAHIVWYLDTRTSNHMTGDKAQFSVLNLSVRGTA